MAVVIAGRTGTDPAEAEPPVASPAGTGGFTWDALQQLPDDNWRRELVNGQLFVTPSPAGQHQRVVGRLHLLLAPTCPSDLEVLLSPSD